MPATTRKSPASPGIFRSGTSVAASATHVGRIGMDLRESSRGPFQGPKAQCYVLCSSRCSLLFILQCEKGRQGTGRVVGFSILPAPRYHSRVHS